MKALTAYLLSSFLLISFLLFSAFASPTFAGDTWVFLGDSLTVATIGNGQSFKAEVKATFGVDITVHNTSRVGKHSYEYVKEIDSILRQYPNAKYFPFMIGTNDVLQYSDSRAAWLRRQLVTVLDKIKAAGRVPILFRIPFRRYQGGDPLAPFNTKVYDPLIAQYSPQWFDKSKNQGMLDLHSFLKANQSYMAGDGVHMTSAGNAAVRKNIQVGIMARVVYGRGGNATQNIQTSSTNQIGLLNQNPNAVAVNQAITQGVNQTGNTINRADQLPTTIDKKAIESLMQSVLKAKSKEDGIFTLCKLEAAFSRADANTLKECKAEIKTFQLLVTALGYDAGGADGLYGPKTKAAGQKVRVALSQCYLKSLGFDAGKIDGIEGPITKAAIAACAQAGGPSANGEISQDYVASLRAKHGSRSII